MKWNKRGEEGEGFSTRHLIYWVLIGAAVIVILVIVNRIINILLTLY